jgi:hypothetical protein
MASPSETPICLFEQIKTILNPILERMNQSITLTRVEIEVIFNVCDYCHVDYDNFMAWFFREEE